MGWIERFLFGREADERVRNAEARWSAAVVSLDEERVNFQIARGRILAAASRPLESQRPQSIPEEED